MHRSLTILALLVAMPQAQAETELRSLITKADNSFQEATEKTAAAYRKSFAAAITSATQIEVYLLDFQIKHFEGPSTGTFWTTLLPEDQFPILPYHSSSKILKRKKLVAGEIKLLMPSLQATIAVDKNDGGAFCHFPIHGIRVWDGDNLIFQTSICHHCSNFYMTYPSGHADWTELSDPNFQEIMERLMPIPQSEIDRFEAKHGPKKKDAKK